MICPKCEEDGVYIRVSEDSFYSAIKFRKRICRNCGHEFITKEEAITVKHYLKLKKGEKNEKTKNISKH